MLVPFTSMVPQNEGFQNPRYVKFEQGFSRKVKSSRIHECIVVVDHEAFLVSAYWEGGAGPNRAVDAACPGLEWRGEIAVVQTGHLVTFRKRVQRLSVANRAVSKSVFFLSFRFLRTLLTTVVQVHLRV